MLRQQQRRRWWRRSSEVEEEEKDADTLEDLCSVEVRDYWSRHLGSVTCSDGDLGDNMNGFDRVWEACYQWEALWGEGAHKGNDDSSCSHHEHHCHDYR